MVSQTSNVLRPDTLLGLSCVVTGAGTGIGRAVALRLCGLGALVLGIGRRSEPLAEVGEAAGDLFTASVCDVRDREAAGDLIRSVGEERGVDVLVNNAGGQFAAPAELITRGGWDSVIDLNLSAPFALAQAAFPYLSRRGGSIVNMTLTPVERGAPGLAHSIAARSGVLGLTRTLAVEWAPNKIRLNCIGPGVVATDAYERNYSEQARGRIETAIPLHRCTKPAEVAELVAYLVSPAGAMITGQLLQVDGGMSLGSVNLLDETVADRSG